MQKVTFKLTFFYRATLSIRGTSHGPVSVRHKSVFVRSSSAVNSTILSHGSISDS